MTHTPDHQRLLIVDFGSQVTQLIARRLRELRIYCEIHPYQKVDAAFLAAFRPQAVILSGGPASVVDAGSPRAAPEIFTLGVPVLGICYGQQTMMVQLGGKVEAGHAAEFGRAYVTPTETADPLFTGLFATGREEVWMSHGDRVTELAPGFAVIGTSPGAPFAITTDPSRHFYAVMFHPEVHHTVNGARILKNFTDLAGFTGDWTMAAYKDQAIAAIRARVGEAKVICGLSGGVDSLGRSRPDPRGDRRPADLRLRRHRPDAPGRGRGSGHPLPRPLQHPADPRRRVRTASSTRSQASPTPKRSARPSAASSSRSSRPAPPRSATPVSSPRAPSTPTSSRASASPAAPRSPSRATTTSAACPSACT